MIKQTTPQRDRYTALKRGTSDGNSTGIVAYVCRRGLHQKALMV
jgi:hypothetical protein